MHTFNINFNNYKFYNYYKSFENVILSISRPHNMKIVDNFTIFFIKWQIENSFMSLFVCIKVVFERML